MTAAGDILKSRVSEMLRDGATPRAIARRLFLFDPTQVFQNDPNRGFSICDEVRANFKLPFSAVRVAGSAQLGFSSYQNRDFVPGQSDLDIAIISPFLFQAYSELVYGITKRYSDLTGFERTNGESNALHFRKYLADGYFRPDLMPKCAKKDEWFRFFSQLGAKHTDWFKNINGGIYFSEAFFEMKNQSVVDDLRKV